MFVLRGAQRTDEQGNGHDRNTGLPIDADSLRLTNPDMQAE
jgi:hypothetical protein